MASLLSAAAARSETVSPQKAQEFTTFVGYEIKPEHFQPAYAPIIRNIVQGSSKPERRALLQQALNTLAERERTETRGRIDIVYFLQGYTLEKLGKRREALAAYGRAVKEKSQSPLYVFRHAYLLKAEGKCERAAAEFDQIAWAVKQASHEPLFLAGECYEALGKTEEAKRHYAEAVRRKPTYAPALRKTLADLRKQLEEEYDPAKKADLENQVKSALETVVEQDPGDHDSALTLAEMYLSNAKNVLSTAQLNRSAELARAFVTSSSFADDRAVHILYESQRRLGKAAEAAEILQKGLKAKPASEPLLADSRQRALEQQLQETDRSGR